MWISVFNLCKLYSYFHALVTPGDNDFSYENGGSFKLFTNPGGEKPDPKVKSITIIVGKKIFKAYSVKKKKN